MTCGLDAFGDVFSGLLAKKKKLQTVSLIDTFFSSLSSGLSILQFLPFYFLSVYFLVVGQLVSCPFFNPPFRLHPRSQRLAQFDPQRPPTQPTLVQLLLTIRFILPGQSASRLFSLLLFSFLLEARR